MAPTNTICFGQQPNGFFPKGFFVDKVLTARELQKQMGGKIVWFCHDSDHDYRETVTKIKTDRYPEGFVRLNINQTSKFQKLFSPLYIKDIKPGWQEETANKLQPIVSNDAYKIFKSIKVTPITRHPEPDEGFNHQTMLRQAQHDNEVSTVADFCIALYRALGWLEGIEVVRSSDPKFRTQALNISSQDHYVDVEYKGSIVHARKNDQEYFLDHGGDTKEFIPTELIPDILSKEQLSPTRDNRFPWMQSVIHCTHYIYGKGEKEYVDFSPWKDIAFVPRKEIHDPDFAVTESKSD
jgi:hypothetical protein